MKSHLRALLCITLPVLAGSCMRLGFSDDRLEQQPDLKADGVTLPSLDTLNDLPDGSGDLPPVVDQQVDGEPWPAEGRWTPTPPAGLAGRRWVFGAWTGKQFAVFGGALNDQFVSAEDGALYDPATQVWTKMQTTGALSKRHAAPLVWDGTRLLIYGGGNGWSGIAGGSRYTPATDSWAPMSTPSVDPVRIYHGALWTGSRMLLWGGFKNANQHMNTGLLYDPVADSWKPTSTTGAPSKRNLFTVVWTGSEALIWGGCDGPMGGCPNMKGDGARYDPINDTWKPMASAGAPSPRKYHTAVWTGTKMIVFGGCTGTSSGSPQGDGGIYDPSSDSWTPISTVNAPSARCAHAAAWLPVLGRMVVWGGVGNGSAPGDGFQYDPATDSWSGISNQNSPGPRTGFAAAATDRCLFIWGGVALNHLNDGGVWCGAAP